MRPRGKLLDVVFLVAAVSFAVSALVSKMLFYNWRPPVEMRTAEALNSPVPVGGDLVVLIDRHKMRDCPVTSTRWAMDEDGRKNHIGAVTWEGGEVGDGTIEVSYPINRLAPGAYTLNVVLAYHCQERVYIVHQPDVKFRVVKEQL